MLIECIAPGGQWSGNRFGVEYDFRPSEKYRGLSIAEVYDERVQKEMFESGHFRKADLPLEDDPNNVRFVVDNYDGVLRVLASLSKGVEDTFDRDSKITELSQLTMVTLKVQAAQAGIRVPSNVPKSELVMYLVDQYEERYKKKALTFT